LTAAGIGTGIHYPIPLHLSNAHAALHFRAGDFPIAERAATEILSLPMFPGLSLDSQRRVAREVLRSTGASEKRIQPGEVPFGVAPKRPGQDDCSQPTP